MLKTSKYVSNLIKHFKNESDPKKAIAMKKYMRDQFPFLGLQSPDRKELMKSFVEKHGRDYSDDDLLTIYNQPEREFKYVAIELAAWQQSSKKITLPASRIELYEKFAQSEPFWDTIDIISSKLIGGHFKEYPNQIKEYTDKWIESDSFWDRRICLLFQLTYKKNDINIELLFTFINKLLVNDNYNKEFFIRKAIGWSLRQLSKTHHNRVFEYIELNRNNLSILSIREGSKYLKKTLI
ncbi:hypothetical protein ACTFIV_008137 [Dictyostelium citrinum]